MVTRLVALLKLRCSHCLQGRVFASLWRMHETCPVCGIRFEREQGYFMMAIFVGYVLSIALLAPVLLALYLIGVTLYVYVLASVLVLFLLSPFIFRYGRVIWLHIDEILDPRRENQK